MPDKADHTRGWLRKGDSDWNAARATIGGIGPYDTACFHAQQAVEKYLKALIAYSDCQIPRSHNLEDLERVCAGLAPTLDLMGIELAELTTYAVQVR